MISFRFLTTMLCVLSLWIAAAHAQANPNPASSNPCLNEIKEIFDGITGFEQDIEICTDAFDGVHFKFRDFFTRGSRRFVQGGGAALLGFRHSGFVFGRPNRLSVELVSRTDEIWDVKFRDSRNPDTVRNNSGVFRYVVWGRNQRGQVEIPRDMFFTDNSMKVFKCGLKEASGCGTYYDIPICEGYNYPNSTRMRDETRLSVKPTLTVSAIGMEAREQMLANYSEISLLARAIVSKSMEISCNYRDD